MNINDLKVGDKIEYYDSKKLYIGKVFHICYNNKSIVMKKDIPDIYGDIVVKDLSLIKKVDYLIYDRVVGLDIGVTTGVTVIDYYKSQLNTYRFDIVLLETVETNYQKFKDIIDKVQLLDTDERKIDYLNVVYEDFRSSVYDKNQKTTIENIGVFKYLCFENDIDYTSQMPSVRKGYLEIAKNIVNANRNLVYLENYEKKHCIDSTAHVLRYLHKEVGINVQSCL